jgi:hypothetical protein
MSNADSVDILQELNKDAKGKCPQQEPEPANEGIMKPTIRAQIYQLMGKYAGTKLLAVLAMEKKLNG